MSAPDLVRVAVYERTIHASLERIWENVLDWEHLPGLHRDSFSAIRCLREDSNGFLARLRGRDVTSNEIDVEVRLDRPGLRYVTETVAGAGKGAQIRTQLATRTPHETDIAVEFLLPGLTPAQTDGVGQFYTKLYAKLWDEDEAMMQRREEMLARVGSFPARGGAGLELGGLAALRARLPLRVEVDGRPFRLIDHEGALVAHSTICPHLFGPLENATPEGDTIECPWHRLRFDLRTGASCDGRGLRLMPAPRVVITPDERVSLRFE